MWWILGIGILIIALTVLLSWPFTMKFAINTDAYGRKWSMKTKIPFRAFEGTYQDGRFDISEHSVRLERLFVGYIRAVYGRLLLVSMENPPSTREDFWDRVLLRCLHFKSIDVQMGVKGVVSGEAAFLFGIIISLLYPVFGYIHSNNRGFSPKISFNKELAGFAVTCIITFSLGQVIHEAGKRYWALWKESK